MKKLAMLTVKGAVGLVPKAVRNKLKSNHKLTEFYSRSLQRSGLFYGFPSEKKRMALYKNYLEHQNRLLSNRTSDDKTNLDLTYIILGHRNISVSLASLTNMGVKNTDINVVTEKPL